MGRECWTQNQEEVMLSSAAGMRMGGAAVILLGSIMAVVVQGVLLVLVSRVSITGRGESQTWLGSGSLVVRCLHAARTQETLDGL